jgi:hypothetical protein
MDGLPGFLKAGRLEARSGDRVQPSGSPWRRQGMGVRDRVWARRRQVVAGISGACLTVMSGGCGGASVSTVPPAATPAPTATIGAVTTPATGVVTTPATTTAPSGDVARLDTHIRVYGNCTTPTIEPAQIVLACADYGVLLEGLHWTSWTAASAMAVGTLVYNDCTPDCAEGHDHDVPGTRITLTVPVHGGGGQLVWSQIQEYPEPPGYKSGPYHGRPQLLPIRPA